MTSHAERRRLTRQRLIDAARDVFVAQPFDEVSIKDLVDAAGVARGSFYNHFADKQALFRVVIDDGMGRMRQAVRTARREATSPEAFFSDMLASALQLELTDTRLVPLAAHGPADVRSQHQGSFGGFASDLEEDLRDGIARGVLAPHDTVTLSTFMIGGAHAVAVRHGRDLAAMQSAVGLLERMFLAATLEQGSGREVGAAAD